MNAKDTAGLTQAEVAELTLEEEYELFGQHYARAGRMLTEAQLVLSDGIWEWNESGLSPVSGFDGGMGRPLPGSDGDTSYYMRIGRIVKLPEATGDTSDQEVMRRYFESKGWLVRDWAVGDTRFLTGFTEDGWQLEYGMQPGGNYWLDVYSELFWTNDVNTLDIAVYERSPWRPPFRTVPGVYEPFPDWDDPLPDVSDTPPLPGVERAKKDNGWDRLGEQKDD